MKMMKKARIYQNLKEFQPELDFLRSWNKKIVMTSGYMAPLHIGHCRLLEHSTNLAHEIGGSLVLVLNSDQMLMNKKGFIFQNQEERAEICAHLRGVNSVIIFDDETPYVSKAIQFLKPAIFTKGGDRQQNSTPSPELNLCAEIGCKVIFGVGGFDKPQSSSNLIQKVKEFEEKQKIITNKE